MSHADRTFRFAVNVTPKPGILDPQGTAVERSLPHLGIDGVADVRVGRRVELTVTAADEAPARAVVERLAGELLSNPLIEAFDGRGARRGGRRRRGRPGERSASASSCSRAPTATSTRSTRLTIAGAEPVILWHESAGPRRRRRDPAAGRVRLRRLPPGGRDRPLQPRDAGGRGLRGSRRAGARDLQRVPGARRGRPRARGPAAQPRPALRVPRGHAAARAARHAVHARARRAGRCGCRSPTARAATTPTTRRSTRWSATASVLWRYANRGRLGRRPDDAGNPNGSLRGIAGVRNAAGNVAGLMPHPETAVRGDPRLRRRPGDHPLVRRELGRVGDDGRDHGRRAARPRRGPPA